MQRDTNHREATVCAPRAPTIHTRTCRHCGRRFKASNGNARFCSKRCNNLFHYKERVASPKKSTADAARGSAVSATVAPPCEYLSVTETAQRLKVCRQTIYNLIDGGKIPFIRLTKRQTYVCWSQLGGVGNQAFTQPQPQSLPPPLPAKHKSSEASSPAEAKKDPPLLWLTLEDTCKRYGVQPGAIYSRVRNHAVPKKRLHGKTVFRADALDRLYGKSPQDFLQGYLSIRACSLKHGLQEHTVRYHVRTREVKSVRAGGRILLCEESFLESYRATVNK